MTDATTRLRILTESGKVAIHAHPGAAVGSIEVRPIAELADMPTA